MELESAGCMRFFSPYKEGLMLIMEEFPECFVTIFFFYFLFFYCAFHQRLYVGI